jgi:hypothetical protein
MDRLSSCGFLKNIPSTFGIVTKCKQARGIVKLAAFTNERIVQITVDFVGRYVGDRGVGNRFTRNELRVMSHKSGVTMSMTFLDLLTNLCESSYPPTPCHVTYLPLPPTPSQPGQWGDSGVY